MQKNTEWWQWGSFFSHISYYLISIKVQHANLLLSILLLLNVNRSVFCNLEQYFILSLVDICVINIVYL